MCFMFFTRQHLFEFMFRLFKEFDRHAREQFYLHSTSHATYFNDGSGAIVRYRGIKVKVQILKLESCGGEFLDE